MWPWAYTYDAQGIRQSKTENGDTTAFLVDPNHPYAQVLGEYAADGREQVFYTHGNDPLAQTRGGTRHYYHYDALGSTRVLTDAAGVPTDSYAYLAFGEIAQASGSTENPYLFTGEQYDPVLQQYYLQTRYMDPSAGRFTQMDTWLGRGHKPVSLHKYLYGDVEPINSIDPAGHMALAQVTATMNILSTSVRIINVAHSVYAKVDAAVSIAQLVHSVHSVLGKVNVNSMVAGAGNNDEGFAVASSDADAAFSVFSRNMGHIVGDITMSSRKRDQLGQFIKNPSNKMIIYGPTPSRSTPWFPPGTHVPLTTLTLSKSTRQVVLELGKASRQGGGMIGVGHSHGKKRSQGTQWFRMDWHQKHEDAYDWYDDRYHFHTETAR